MSLVTSRPSGTRRPLPERNLSQWNRVQPLSDPALWLEDALRDANALERLSTGWDGTDSAAPARSVIELARRLVLAAAHVPNLSAPHIGPVPGGGMQLEWHISGKDLELEILPDGKLLYLRIAGNEQDEGEIALERVENAVVLMAWLTR